jgi:DNA-binding response OmpR family regulator
VTKRTRPTVLIADDDANLRLLVHATIKLEHFVLLEAADGDEAWAAIQRYRPSLVLLDVQMPGKSGLEILRLIRNTEEVKNTWVILLTARAKRSDIESATAAGADNYLTKPFSPLELLRCVEWAVAS